jgi:hypothetical protein
MFFVAHYKSVSGSYEFYSSVQDSIQFPIQVSYKSETFYLEKTYQVPSVSFHSNIIKAAENHGIEYNVDVASLV